ncbi:putative ABC multidrug transporter, partial [Aureobasidium melanogenum]
MESMPNQPGTVFGYATTFDKTVLYSSACGAFLAGAMNPLITAIQGRLVSGLNEFSAGSTTTTDLESTVSQATKLYVYLSLTIFSLVFASTAGFYHCGERIATALRCAYLDAILRQDMSYHDHLAPGRASNRIMTDLGIIQEGISSKLSVALSAFAIFATALVITFTMHWKIAVLTLPFFAAMVISSTITGRTSVKHHKAAARIYDSASSLAQEAIASTKHVHAYGLRNVLQRKFSAYLQAASRPDLDGRHTISVFIAWSNAMPCLLYALVFWVGSILLTREEVSVFDITTAAYAGVIGAFSIARVGPSAQTLIASMSSAKDVLETISQSSSQNSKSFHGLQPAETIGDIEFRGVSLIYPSRASVRVLDQISFKCPAGKKTALVGASALDNIDIATLNLGWLRRSIGFVSQEPSLFNTTIYENIRYGFIHTQDVLSENEVSDRIISAAKDAYAHEFIMALPDGYQSIVGESGARLSGGQRQRIAIARAIVRNPAILLLDEATSALDSRSEEMVQKALDKATEHRTSIVIAHRLSTIHNADNIVVISAGKVVEQGSRDQLLANGGIYHDLEMKGHTKMNMQQKYNVSSNKPDRNFEEGTNHYANSIGNADEKANAVCDDSDSDIESQVAQARFSIGQTLKYLYRLNKPESRLLLAGLFSAAVAGLSYPTQSIIMSRIWEAFALPKSKYPQLEADVSYYAILYLLMAAVAMISWLGVGFAFGRSTIALAQRLKARTFDSILSQDISFFDARAHSIGALTYLLNTATEDLINLGGPTIGGILTFTATILVGVLIAFANAWKLALLCTGTVPVVVACGWFRMQILAVFDAQSRQSGKDAAAYANELVRNVRTIATLGLESVSVSQYNSLLKDKTDQSLSSMLAASALYAASHSVVYLCTAVAFRYGAALVADREYTVYQFYICYTAVVAGSQLAGSIFTFAPDASKAMYASYDLHDLYSSKSRINSSIGIGSKLPSEKQLGAIQFQKVSFSYPSDPARQILDGLDLEIPPGSFIAIVGPSGCGKSTLLSLIERFYDPTSGCVRIDGQDIAKVDVAHHRSSISFVGQQPTVYSGTIGENLAYALPDEFVSERAMLDACQQARIHDFIASLPEPMLTHNGRDGLATRVGTAGGMLSGGQRQRLAIAQALLRRPKILLLDEATSALDANSEALVHEVLMSKALQRTTIAVAHRLSTVRGADCIYVLDAGKIVDSGRHADLVARRGLYYELVSSQVID